MPTAVLAPVAGAVVGGLMGDKGGGGGQTASKEPWEAAAPWLRQNIQTGQDLQNFYQKNPFNQQQQQAYQNIFSDQANFRNQIAPGMMDFANKLMGSNYQRAPSMFEQQPGRGAMGGLVGGGGQYPMQPQQPMQQQPQQTKPFTMAPAPTGATPAPVNFDAQNPYNNDLKPSDKAPVDTRTIQELVDEAMRKKAEDRALAEKYFDSGN